MSAHCQVTGRKPGFGKSVSHSHVRTNRRWDPNIQKKTYFVPSLRRNVTLTLSAKGIKVGLTRTAIPTYLFGNSGKQCPGVFMKGANVRRVS